MDKLTKEQRRKNMQAIKNKGSEIENILSKALWNRGHRYRKNDTSVYGKPDLTFKKFKIAIFADSEFWHGKDWEIKKNDFKSNREFWIRKIETNIARDKTVNRILKQNGWKVLRFWGKEIKKNVDYCILKIEIEILKRKK